MTIATNILTSQFFPSQSVVHRALACPDILEELALHIAEDIEEDSWSWKSESRQIVSRLSRVNRAFNAFFIKKLWATLPSIEPLLRVLSALVVVDFEQPSSHKAYVSTEGSYINHRRTSILQVLSGPIDAAEWSRCMYLGSLVRRLYGITSTLAAPSVWMYHAVLLGEKTLLPSVQELHWTIKSSTSVELVLLVSPSLPMLFLSLEDSDHSQDTG